MPQLDPGSFAPQLVWLAISFVILYLLMARLALPRIGEVLESRQDRIAHDLDAATSLKVEAENALAEYEAAMAEARSKAQVLLAQAADAWAREDAARHTELDARIAGQLRDAESRIDRARQAAMANIGEVVGDVARTATAKLIGVEPGDDAVAAALAATVEGDG